MRTQELPVPWLRSRVVRPSHDLEQGRAFYSGVVGLPEDGGFTGHAGYDGAFFRLPDGGQLELTIGGEAPGPTTSEDLLVLYVADAVALAATVARLNEHGVQRVTLPNPYWEEHGATFLDPDGYRLAVAVDDTPAFSRVGAELFNRVWSLLGQADRDDDLLLHTAHASAYHWRCVGTPQHLARSEWLCSRVYAVLGRAEPSRWHAQRVLGLCRDNGIGDWDLAFAYEALARAAAVAGDADATASYLQLAREQGEQIADQEDRDLLVKDLASITVPS